MRRYVPLYGPLKGQACYRHEDGSLELAPEVDSAHAPPAVVVPSEFSGDERATNRWKRESVSQMQGQMVGSGVHHEAAREYAVAAAHRSDARHGNGQAVRYPNRSTR